MGGFSTLTVYKTSLSYDFTDTNDDNNYTYLKKTVKLLKGRHLYMFYPAMCEICFIHISKIRGNFLMEMA